MKVSTKEQQCTELRLKLYMKYKTLNEEQKDVMYGIINKMSAKERQVFNQFLNKVEENK